jgi:hypothetical protein
MYKTILVTTDIEDGRRILQELEKRQLQVTAAFWFHYEDEDEWKLVIVTSEVEEKGPTALYSMLAVALNDLSIDEQKPLQFPLDRIRLVSPYSLVYKMVKQHAGPVGGSVREGPILDAYIYKMS